MHKKLRRGGIKIRSRAVHALHNGLIQPSGESLLGQIVLVLSYAYGLGIYLYKLSQRVEEPSRDGHGRSLFDGHIRELFSRGLLRGPDRGARLRDYRVADIKAVLSYQLRHQLLALAGSCPVAYGYKLYVIFLYELHELSFGTEALGIFASEGVYLVRREHPAGPVYYGELATVVEARVKAEDNSSKKRRLKEKLLKVFGEYLDRGSLGPFAEVRPYLPLYRWEQKPVTAVFGGSFQIFAGDALFAPGQSRYRFFFKQIPVVLEGDGYHLLLLCPVYRHNAVVGKRCEALAVVVVVPVDLFLVLCVLFLLCDDRSGLQDTVFEIPSLCSVVAHHLRYDILSALNRCRDILYLFVYVFFCLLLHGAFLRKREHEIRKPLEPRLDRDSGPGLLFLHIRPVYVIYLRELCARQYGSLYLIREFSLLGDEPYNILLALGKLQLVVVLLLYDQDLLFVQTFCLFLAVARYERNRISLGEHLQCISDLVLRYLEFRGQCSDNFFVHQKRLT